MSNRFYTNYNRLSDINGLNPSFDKDGNMTQGLLAGENSSFSFDSRNRLSQIQNSTGSSQYQYDAKNQRIALSHNGQTTRFVINSQPNLSQMLLKTDPDGTQTYYVYGLGLIGDESQGNYRSYHPDYRGSTVALSDETGQVTQRFTYSPYGTLVKGDASQTPFLFNGLYGVMTDANGLYYMRARYYNAEIRRFVNQDLLLGYIQDGGTLNRFAYVTGNPVSFVDPFGLAKCTYKITTHELICISNSSINSSFIGPPETHKLDSNYTHSGRLEHKNNIDSINIEDFGPIPLGRYNIFPNEIPARKGKNWWALQEIGWNKFDSLMHKLKLKRAGANLHLGTSSWGCITVNKEIKNQYSDLTNFLKKELENNTLTVIK